METTNTELRYFNRELSWLEFNQRVLNEAFNSELPLLERLKFLAITDSNLDEFYKVRVAGLQTLAQRGSARRDPAGLTPREQLQAVTERAARMVDDQNRCYLEQLEPALAEAGIRRLRAGQLNPRQQQVLENRFESEITTILSPIAVRLGDDVPLLTDLTLNVAVLLAPAASEPDQPRVAIIPFARYAGRFITLPAEGGYAFMLLEDAVALHIDEFFPGEEVLECAPFRLTRNADLQFRDDLASDLLADMEEMLDERKQSACVRLQVAEGVSDALLDFLRRLFSVEEADVLRIAGPIELSAFMRLTGLEGFDRLRYDEWPPQPSPEIDLTQNLFEQIARRDILLYHPYDSFEPVVRLIEEAAADPDVLAIKQILYRTSRNSPIVAALMRAAVAGKYVTVLVELKARFDEARNIQWAREMERAGVQVIYGVKGLKTHAKVCVIVRREPHGIQRYLHLGTGNYNEATARIYSDASLLTSNEELGADAAAFFNAVSGYSQPINFRKIEMAPVGLRDRLLEMILVETHAAERGERGYIAAKVNSLVDPGIIEALYEASQAGVRIKLNIRGICCLRPGVPGLSENISVVSIVDRFLEHARILYFYHGGDERVFTSSADWMPRNLDRRVEPLVPVEDLTCRARLIQILDSYFLDNVKARKLQPDGTYTPVPDEGRPFRSQQWLYEQAVQAVRQAEASQRTVLEPHRAGGDG